MDSAMRDLDQLRERSDDSQSRKIGLIALATMLSATALFAMTTVLGGSSSGSTAPEDPLADLMLSTKAREKPRAEAAKVDVEPTSLSFPAALIDREQPFVEATLQAAAAEHAALTGQREEPAASGQMPASRIAATESARLAQLAKHDVLVARSLPERIKRDVAPSGSEGAYTLQVVSYDSRDQADQFAGVLRSRGHKAYVVEAEVEGRGRFFRVRVGPFTTRREAESYQGQFENDEHMHTIVVSSPAK